MPNVVAHMVIAEAVSPLASPDYVLSSALPDFVGMAKDFRGSTTTVRDLRQNPLLSEGIALHQTTDSVFDQLPESRELIIHAREDLASIGLSRGALRVCADIGTEILLDGVVMERGNITAYNNVHTQLNRGDSALSTVKDTKLTSLIGDYFATGRPSRYKSPELVASMLQYRLLCRKNDKLRFEESKIPDVAEVFAKQQSRIRKCADKMIKLTVANVRAALANS